MVRLTREVIRKKAEHHDGILGDMEEISLHQLEIERIETIGTLCRKLRILYLQNNIISRIEGLHHLKDLEYLNLALNNVTVVEGLQFVAAPGPAAPAPRFVGEATGQIWAGRCV